MGKLDEAIVVLTEKGKAKYMRISAAPAGKRAAKGDFVISMGAKERVAAVARYQASIGMPEAEEE